MTSWGKIGSNLFEECDGFPHGLDYCWAVLSTWVLRDRLAQKNVVTLAVLLRRMSILCETALQAESERVPIVDEFWGLDATWRGL